MLNPEIIKVFGEESTPMIMDLIELLGESVASSCYVVSDDYLYLNGARVPQFYATDIEDKEGVEDKLFDFIDKHVGDKDETCGIFLIYDRKPMREDLRLWLC